MSGQLMSGQLMSGCIGSALMGDPSGDRSTVEPPRAVPVGAEFVVEGVVVPRDELDRPARRALAGEDHIADRGGFVLVPVGDEGVDDQMALRALGLPPRV